MTDARKHFAQQTSCVLSCTLFIHKSSSLFDTYKVVTDSNFIRLLLKKKNKQTNKNKTKQKQNKTKQNKQKQKNKKQKQTNKKPTLKTAFRSGLPICHKV